ncbi:MAG: DUF2147 domain-containing protein [Bacteroidetes bacterium]|nr:DUF2147 domain-containing protein [Bacteroidota bacterium]
MRQVIFSVLLTLLSTSLFAQSAVGKWKTIDDKTGRVKSCEMWLKPGDSNTLEVRGYWGWGFRTQTWTRTK